MDIESILSSLGLDLTNPEAKKGAIEAIDAILSSRQPDTSLGGAMPGGTSSEEDIEVDPDLLQPSIKNKPQGNSDDIEINDEEDILKDVKHNKPEDPQEATTSDNTEDDSTDDENSAPDQKDTSANSDRNSDNPESKSADNQKNDDHENKSDDQNTIPNKATEDEINDPEIEVDDNSNIDVSGANSEGTEDDDTEGEPLEDGEELDADYNDEFEDSEVDGFDNDFDGESDDSIGTDETENEDEPEDEVDEDEFDIDEDELMDDDLKDTYEDQSEKTKHDARKIKRERTLQAAKKALADAQSKNKSSALIHELEKAIEALEGLQEAISKTIKDISDEEFNMMVNRVFDAIDALGDSELTYTSEEERQIKAQEIKADLENKQTQAELSAEDVAKIRAETQAAKAREKEAAKYKEAGRGYFKGFQDFLNSLYRAVALQVATAEERDDTWAAINRRYGGTGILKQGQKFNELPNKKIPVIDFYFDQSGSWDEDDIAVGEKAVAALADMEEKGQIKINVYYFADDVHTDAESARIEGGTRAWNEIVKNVIATKATNVIIMTDWDMERQGVRNGALSYTVPGYVWYLWRDGYNAPRLPRDLKGRGGTQQFSFSSGGI